MRLAKGIITGGGSTEMPSSPTISPNIMSSLNSTPTNNNLPGVFFPKRDERKLQLNHTDLENSAQDSLYDSSCPETPNHKAPNIN